LEFLRLAPNAFACHNNEDLLAIKGGVKGVGQRKEKRAFG